MPRSDRSLRNFTPINVFAITCLSHANFSQNIRKFRKTSHCRSQQFALLALLLWMYFA